MRGGALIACLRRLRLLDASDSMVATEATPEPERPRGYWGPYPIHSHRTMAQVMRDEGRE